MVPVSPYDFFQRYFVQPLLTGEGYNIYNTLAYGLLLILGGFGVLRLLKRLGVGMDRGLFWATLPFMILAGFLRALEHLALSTGQGPLPVNPLFVTPGIYLLVTALAIAPLLAGSYYRKGLLAMKIFGVFLSAGALYLFYRDLAMVSSGEVAYPTGELLKLRPLLFLQILLVSVIVAALVVGVLRRWGMATPENSLIMGGFAFEGSSVAIAAMKLGYTAEQPLTRFLVDISPPFYLLLTVGLILWILRYAEGERNGGDEYYWLTKLLLLALGLPMGIHNSLQILLGV